MYPSDKYGAVKITTPINSAPAPVKRAGRTRLCTGAPPLTHDCKESAATSGSAAVGNAKKYAGRVPLMIGRRRTNSVKGMSLARYRQMADAAMYDTTRDRAVKSSGMRDAISDSNTQVVMPTYNMPVYVWFVTPQKLPSCCVPTIREPKSPSRS